MAVTWLTSTIYNVAIFLMYIGEAQWSSGSESDSQSRGRGFDPRSQPLRVGLQQANSISIALLFEFIIRAPYLGCNRDSWTSETRDKTIL